MDEKLKTSGDDPLLLRCFVGFIFLLRKAQKNPDVCEKQSLSIRKLGMDRIRSERENNKF